MIPISVCIITKNEAENLEKCLSALRPYPFEIVVVDTGSTDNSIDIAKKFTDKVYTFEWINDFSAARNYAVSRASHNTILSLDTDEFITAIDLNALNRSIDSNPKQVGCIKLNNYFETDGIRRCVEERLDRLFNRKYYRYERSIHETLVPKDNILYQTYEVPITADHVGYLMPQEKLNEKSMRNIELLFKDLNAGDTNPYTYFQIAQSYLVMRQEEQALPYYRLAMEHNPPIDNAYTRILVKNYGEILLTYGKAEEALSLLSYYDAFQNNADYLCLIGSIYLQLNNPLKALPEFIKALTAPEYNSPSAKKEIPSFYIGHIYQCFGQIDIAKSHFKRCGDYPPALERLKNL